jgi:hypothetical protein
MGFLPTDYKIPEKSSYCKLKDGANNIRILSSAVVGWEYWNTDNKPVRSRTPYTTMPSDIKIDKDGNTTKIKHFWAFIVWNYEAEAVQILEVTQSTIQGAIKAMVDNKKWGNPEGFDITITRTGEGFDTEYSVMPNPHSPVEPKIKAALKALPINLEALYDGSNPFGESKKEDGRDDEGFAKSIVAPELPQEERPNVEDIPF